jgi:type VI secretion system secreted protein VgrG
MFTDNYMAVALHGHKTACGATLIAAASMPELSPASTSPANPPGSAFNGKLGQNVDSLVAMSPTLNSNLKTLQSQGWTVDYGPAGQGSYADRRTKTITLDEESAATLKNIQIPREIVAAGGPDIGIAGNPKNHASYIQAYNQYLKDGNAEVAIRKIGSQFGNGEFTSTTGQNYADYYGGWYDKHHGGK